MKCSYFLQSHCRSCNLLDKSYPDTLIQKERELKSLFPDDNIYFKPTIGIEQNVEGSRSKAKFAVFSKNGDVTFGFYQGDGTPTELEFCPLHSEGINSLLPVIRQTLNQFQIIPYDLKTKKGELKYCLISKSAQHNSSEYLIRFVLRSKESLDRLRKASVALQDLVPEIKVVTANIQPIHQAIIEGDEEIILSKDLAIIHQFGEFQLALGARSFFQVTPPIAKKLYSAVADSIFNDLPNSLIDLYCGVGAFSFYASRNCPNIVGIEISKEAIDCALISNRLNNTNIEFVAMDVEEYLKNNPKKFNAVIINPPRRGLNSTIIKMINEISPEFIYYSSCNAETMARDWEELSSRYEIQSLQIFDMFPFTSHFETLMCIVKK